MLKLLTPVMLWSIFFIFEPKLTEELQELFILRSSVDAILVSIYSQFN